MTISAGNGSGRVPADAIATASGPLSLSRRSVGREQRVEGARVPYRVRVSVVVEVDEHVLVRQTPFPDSVSPPCQVSIGVRAGVQVIMIRAVHPQVDEVCSSAQ